MTTETGLDPLVHLGSSLDALADVVDGVDPTRWADPTPCAGWDVGDLVGHLRDGTWWFAGALGGPPPGGDPDVRPGPSLRRAHAALVAGFARPGALESTLTVPLGPVPGAVALHLRATEALVHAWDLCAATGQVLAVDDDVVAEALAFSEAAVGMIPPDASPFGPSIPVASDAPALDRLVALLGRDPAAAPGRRASRS